MKTRFNKKKANVLRNIANLITFAILTSLVFSIDKKFSINKSPPHENRDKSPNGPEGPPSSESLTDSEFWKKLLEDSKYKSHFLGFEKTTEMTENLLNNQTLKYDIFEKKSQGRFKTFG